MFTQTTIKNLVALLLLTLMLAAGNVMQAPSVQAVSADRVKIDHYVNGKIVGTHWVSDDFFAWAISHGYWGERLDELYHFCNEEGHQNDPRCRHML